MTEKKSVLITGASSGIGKACALHLDKMGFKVFAGVRKAQDGEALKSAAGALLTPVILDVVKEDDIAKVLDIVSKETGYPLYGLVNNAGIGRNGVLEAVPPGELRKVLEVNVIGMHAVTRAFLPLLRKSKGRVINIGSIASFMSSPGGSSYAASKFAVRALTDALRTELKLFGMYASLVAPGAIESDIWEKGLAYKNKLRETVDPELLKAYAVIVRSGDKLLERLKPIPAVNVAIAVAHGLTAKKPKPVYLVGKDSKMIYKARRLPKDFIDGIILKHMHRLAQ